MKKLLLILSLSFFFSQAHGNEALKKSMEVMGAQFKIIATGLQLGSVGEEQIKAAEILRIETKVSAAIYPDNATTEELKKQYDVWMAEQLKLVVELEDVLAEVAQQDPQDLGPVIKKFVAINELRKEAHDLFKE